MSEELDILRKLAANPYDLGTLGAYADWLRDHGREADEAEVRRAMAKAPRPTNQARYYMRVESDAGAVEYGCQTWEELVAISGKRVRSPEEQARDWAVLRDAMQNARPT